MSNFKEFVGQEGIYYSHVDNAALSTLPIGAGNRLWAVRLEESSIEDSSRPQAAKQAHQRL